MSNRAGHVPYDDFTGGEAFIYPASDMKPKYSKLLQNCHVFSDGAVSKIPGYIKVNSSDVSDGLLSGFEFKQSDGTIIELTAGNGTIYEVLGTGELSAIKTGLDASAKVYFSQINDLCIMSNGVDAMMKYDGATVSNLGGTPPATGFKSHVHKNRVWIIERTDKMLATHSALNAAEDYTTAADAGYIDFKYVLGRGDELLDIVTYIDLLVFFFRNHVVIYSGSDPTASGDFAIVQKIEGAGVINSDAIVSYGSDLAFIYGSGIKSLRQTVTTGSLNIADLSEKIDPDLRADIAAGGNTSVAHYPKYGWLAFLINGIVRIYSYTWKAWGRMVGGDILGMFATADGALRLCGTGFLYTYDSGYDFAGTNPVYRWETAHIIISKIAKVYPKIMQLLAYPLESTTASLQTIYDQKDSPAEQYIDFDVTPGSIVYIDAVTDWDALAFIDEVSYTEIRLPLFGGGNTVQMIFTNTSDKQLSFGAMNLQVVRGGF